jgi:autotransporter-associated beta strand protein
MNAHRFLLIAAAAHSAALTSSVSAAYHQWRGGASYPYWSNAANWSSGGAPAQGESGFVHLDFGPSATDFSSTSDIYALHVDKMTFSGPTAWSIGTRADGPITLKSQDSGDSLSNTCPTLHFYYPLMLTGNHRVYSHTGTDLWLETPCAGTGGFTFRGAGTTHIGGLAANTFTGTTTVLQGRVNLEKETGPAFGGALVIGETGADEAAYVYVVRGGQIPDASPVMVHSNSWLFVSNMNETIGALTMTGGKVYGGNGGTGGNSRLTLNGPVSVPATATETPTLSGDVSFGSSSRDFTVAGGTSMIVFANLYSPNPNAGINKRGDGTLTLYGENALLGGPVNVRDGRLIMRNNQPSSTVVIHPGAELLAFSASLGEITGTGGRLHVSYIATAISAVNCGSVQLSGESTFRTDLHGPNNGTQYGQLAVMGSVTLDDCALEVALSYDAPIGQLFAIIDNDGADPVIGTFRNLPEGARAIFDDVVWQITYQGGTGNDVVLTRKADPARLDAIVRQLNGVVLITGTGAPGRTYRKEASEDLVTWIDFGPVTSAGDGILQFTDPAARTLPRRFYRCPAQ